MIRIGRAIRSLSRGDDNDSVRLMEYAVLLALVAAACLVAIALYSN